MSPGFGAAHWERILGSYLWGRAWTCSPELADSGSSGYPPPGPIPAQVQGAHSSTRRSMAVQADVVTSETGNFPCCSGGSRTLESLLHHGVSATPLLPANPSVQNLWSRACLGPYPHYRWVLAERPWSLK